jgi:hypothetical protein
MLHRFFARVTAVTALVVVASASPAVADAVQVNFSGGAGTPLTITLPQPISYTVTPFVAAVPPAFVFKDVGNIMPGPFLTGEFGPVSGTLSYTVNGGSALSINRAGTVSFGIVDGDDLTIGFSDDFAGVTVGDVIILSSGSVTTDFNVAAAPPSPALHDAIMVVAGGPVGLQLANGVPIPEPAGFALLAFIGVSMCGRRRDASER